MTKTNNKYEASCIVSFCFCWQNIAFFTFSKCIFTSMQVCGVEVISVFIVSYFSNHGNKNCSTPFAFFIERYKS